MRCSYHLINLFQSPALELRKEEEDPNGGNDAGGRPDKAVSGSPVEGAGVDEVGGGESGDPGTEEANGGGKTEGVGSKALGGNFTAGQPGVRSNHTLEMV